MKGAEARVNNSDSDTNHTPPMHCLCDNCSGGGRTWKPDWELSKDGGEDVERCPICAGTGRNPLPIPEVIGGLRRGVLDHAQAKIWNGKLPEAGNS